MSTVVDSIRKPLLYLILLAAFSMLAFTGLNGSLQNVDEVLYARVSRETFEHGSWLVQYKDGSAWFHKSPMLFWGVMLSYKLFGVSDVSARLPSAVAGVVSAFLIFFITRKLFGSATAGVIGGLIYLTSIQVYVSTHQVAIDSLLAMFLLLTLFFTIKGIEDSKGFLLLAGVSNAMVFLTKSILGFVVPAAFLLYLVIEKRWHLLQYLAALFVISIAGAAPYFLFIYRTIPDMFVGSFLHENLLDRFYSGSGLPAVKLLYRLGYGLLFYAVFLVLFTVPYTGVFAALFGRRNKPGPGGEPLLAGEVMWRGPRKLLTLSFLVTLIGYSLLGGKWPHWTMPMIPPIIVFLGYLLSSGRSRNQYIALSSFSFLAVALLLIVFAVEGGRHPTYRVVFLGLAALYGLFCAASLLLYARRAPAEKGVFWLVAGFFISFTLLTAVTVPLDFNSDIKTFSRVVYDQRSPLYVVGSSKVNEGNKRTVTIWYLKMRGVDYKSLDQFTKRVPNPERGSYIIYNREYRERLGELYPTFTTLKTGRIWNIGRVE